MLVNLTKLLMLTKFQLGQITRPSQSSRISRNLRESP